jgi:flagellar basal body-associated protein FliL
MTGKLITLKIRVSALVASADAERAKTLVEANKARINDRINFVVRSAEPQDLNEPGLETIKRRIKHELAKVLDDERLLQEVLIPEMLQSGSGL